MAFGDEPKFNKVCAQEGTRLATPLTEDENDELIKFMEKNEKDQVRFISCIIDKSNTTISEINYTHLSKLAPARWSLLQ